MTRVRKTGRMPVFLSRLEGLLRNADLTVCVALVGNSYKAALRALTCRQDQPDHKAQWIVKSLLDEAVKFLAVDARPHVVCPNSLLFDVGCTQYSEKGSCKHGGIHLIDGHYVRTELPCTEQPAVQGARSTLLLAP